MDSRTKGAAVLQCGPIIWEHLATEVGALKQWGKDNAKHILEKEALTREHGFFIVTATRKTNWCKLKCLSKNTKTTTPTFSAGLPYTGPQIGATTEVQSDKTLSAGWIIRPANDESVIAYRNRNFLSVRLSPERSSSCLLRGTFLFLEFLGN